jgi:hypothetical protein
MAFPALRPGDVDRGIYDVAHLPSTGLVLERDVLTIQGAPRSRIIPIGPASWKRRQRLGDAPPTVMMFSNRCLHAEHVRAVATGQDWRAVVIPTDQPASAA